MRKSITVVVPCYNEYSRLPFSAFDRFLRINNHIIFCFVNDGSKDKTIVRLNELKALHSHSVFIVDNSSNLGKAEAVRQGMLFSINFLDTEYVAFLDADLSTSLIEAMRLFQIMEENSLLFVFGSRVATYGNMIERYGFRHYGGRIFATIVSMMLGLVIYDTQCGIKIFTKELANRLFQDSFKDRWIFDVEIFARLKNMYNPEKLRKIMREIPLNEWTETGSSRIKCIDLLKIPVSLFKIWLAYR